MDVIYKQLVFLYIQTHGGKEGEGFSRYDSPILSSFAEQYIRARCLSVKQIDVLKKRLSKYSKQLERLPTGYSPEVLKSEAQTTTTTRTYTPTECLISD
jgi:hypothetical protein